MNTPEAAPAPSAQAATFAEVLRATTPTVWVTPAIVGVNVVVFAAMVATGVSPLAPSSIELLKWGADFGPATVIDGEWWRILTAAFLHIGVLHLGFNMYALWGVGATAERVFGNAAFLALYVVAAVAGSFVSILWTPSVVSAGASGAVFGVYGAILAFVLREGHDSLTTELAVLRKSILGFIGYNLFYGLTMPNISNAAHLGGLVAGFSAGGLLARDLQAASVAGARHYLRAAALVPVLAALAWGAHCRVSMLPMIQGAAAQIGGDWLKAAALFKQACDGGDMAGCNRLGWTYANGQGVPKDEVRAAFLYKLACDDGVVYGCGNLGWLYASGSGVPKDEARAAALYKQACDGSEMTACGNLGRSYEGGRGVPKDETRAAALYKQACDSGAMMFACSNLGGLYANGVGVPKDEARAAALYKQACDGGNVRGCGNLGWLHEGGRGVPKDEARAATLYKQACDGSEMISCRNLAWLHANGVGVPKDESRAATLYKQACDGGVMHSCTDLGGLYLNGMGVPKDESRTAALFKQACDGGEMFGCDLLGWLHQDGRGVPKDEARAAALYKQACDGGAMHSCNNLGFLYANGVGVPRDPARAATLYKRACGGGVVKSCDRLKERSATADAR